MPSLAIPGPTTTPLAGLVAEATTEPSASPSPTEAPSATAAPTPLPASPSPGPTATPRPALDRLAGGDVRPPVALPARVELHPGQLSVTPGQGLDLHVSTPAATYRLAVARADATGPR
jgi:hypothetical protein